MFVKLQRENTWAPYFGCANVIEGMCRLCVSVCVCVCAAECACLFGCLNEGKRQEPAYLTGLPTWESLNAPQLYGGPFSDQWLAWSVWSHSLNGYLMEPACLPGRHWCWYVGLVFSLTLDISQPQKCDDSPSFSWTSCLLSNHFTTLMGCMIVFFNHNLYSHHYTISFVASKQAFPFSTQLYEQITGLQLCTTWI